MTPEFISQLKLMRDPEIHVLVAKHILGDARYRASLASQLVEAKHDLRRRVMPADTGAPPDEICRQAHRMDMDTRYLAAILAKRNQKRSKK